MRQVFVEWEDQICSKIELIDASVLLCRMKSQENTVQSWHRRSVFCHHLISLFARASSSDGIVKPICFAVFRLMTNSNFVGCSTGRSEGFAPFRILSTREATRWFLSGASYPYDMSPPASTSVRLLNIAGSRFLRRAR